MSSSLPSGSDDQEKKNRKKTNTVTQERECRRKTEAKQRDRP
jgi:hypothetical protein